MPRVDDIGAEELSALLEKRVLAALDEAGGWLPFDRYMAMALYEPGLGYYARGAPIFGLHPAAPGGGSDFVTAPEMSPLFGAALARQVAEVLLLGHLEQVIEFGAGSGALAEQLLEALRDAGVPLRRYSIVELTGTLRVRQQARLARFGPQVQWLDTWPVQGPDGPEAVEAVVVGNEVLDAMPVKLLHRDDSAWFERGVVAAPPGGPRRLAFGDRPTSLRPPRAHEALPGAVLEIHPQATAFVSTVAARLARGAAFFVDYGFPEAEYYHRQRHQGTLMSHRAHRSFSDAGEALVEPGLRDITSHVDFTAMALAAQEAGAEVVGYTSQARFLLNCGLLELMEGADIRRVAAAQKLLAEHEMGELFKVLAFARGVPFPAGGPLGFVAGDRTHML
ncbi:MAG: SAM-dependent methyltransferase [Rubrivivax sp.]|nr:SAM-dependent methyltransferase [Rubrivivax sp.]